MNKVTTENPKRPAGAIERIALKRLGTSADMAGAALAAFVLYRRPNPGGGR
jgi:3-oxoacyl-[acyl-carrier protein] reductase